MKTKLLRKIRKQYSIVYYPNGQEPSSFFRVHEKQIYYVEGKGRGCFRITKQECLDWILNQVKENYRKYSRKYNENKYKPIKVWYNS